VFRLAIVGGFLASCTFTPPDLDPGGDDDLPDQGPSPMEGCHGTTSYSRACLVSEPTSSLTLSGRIDTATAPCRPTRPGTAAGACVLAGTTVSLGDTVVVGPRPLLIVATAGVLTLDGALDAGSHSGGEIGAGAGGNTCQIGLAATSRGGGQGGSFGFKGGDGGDGDQDAVRSDGGTAGEPTALEGKLRGGCPGASGRGANGGAGGAAGGAIALVSSVRVEMSGWINASGAAGAHGTAGAEGAGGGGGGSGGMVVLDAPQLQLSGRLFAVGGGGGGASDRDNAGVPGGDVTPPNLGTGGRGGGDAGAGGNGSEIGNGGTGRNSSGGGGLPGGGGNRAGGGGGGGGGGVILLTDRKAQLNASTFPAVRYL
jgi:hypothetical protein